MKSAFLKEKFSQYLCFTVTIGFCDYSDTAWGIYVLDFLKQQDEKSSMSANPKIVFKKCGSNNEEIFPWGYVGFKKSKYFKDQNDLNKLKAKLLEKTDLYDKLVKKEGKNLSNLLDEHGMSHKNTGYDKPFIVWFDNDIIVTSVISSHIVNNEQYNEKLISADTVVDDIIFTYTTYDDKGDLGIDTKSFALNPVSYTHLTLPTILLV